MHPGLMAVCLILGTILYLVMEQPSLFWCIVLPFGVLCIVHHCVFQMVERK